MNTSCRSKPGEWSLGIQILPLGVPESAAVAAEAAAQALAASGLVTAEGPMETTLVGEMDELFAAFKVAQEAGLSAGLAVGIRQVCSVLRFSNACPTGEVAGKATAAPEICCCQPGNVL